MNTNAFFASGRCVCGEINYVLICNPLFVHCCHCSWCQCETGSAFALNALIESEQVCVTKGIVEKCNLPSNSGNGQTTMRCSKCKVTLWSHFGGAGEKVAFVRVGTLDIPNLCPPDIHIYTSSKQSWVELSDSVAKVDEYYRRSEYWPEDSIKRYKAALGLIA